MTDIGEVDQWISQLSQCKQLSESDVKKLCDKVCIRPLCVCMFFSTHSPLTRHAKFLWRNLTSSRCAAR